MAESDLIGASSLSTTKTMDKGGKRQREEEEEEKRRIRCAVLSHLCQSSRKVEPPLLQTYFVCLCRLGSHVLPTQLSRVSPVCP